MINDKRDLAAHLGVDEGRAGVEHIARRLYKDTSCGIVFAAIEGGVQVGGYCEGFDGELPTHDLLYPFTGDAFDALVAQADREGCDMWDDVHQ